MDIFLARYWNDSASFVVEFPANAELKAALQAQWLSVSCTHISQTSSKSNGNAYIISRPFTLMAATQCSISLTADVKSPTQL